MTNEPCRILIIDDSPDDRADLRKMLRTGSNRRYQFTERELGATGVQEVRSGKDRLPDCVLLDYHLPDMNAEEVLTELRAGSELPPCPVVVITGGDKDSGARIIRAGAQDYLDKSWSTPESLTRAVENAMERFTLIVERLRAEAALAEAQGRLRFALEASQTGVWEWDVQKNTVHWSPECYKIHGLHEGEFDGTTEGFGRLVHAQDAERVWKTVGASMTNHSPYACEFRILRPDGDVRWVASSGRSIFDASGKPLLVVGTTIDTTERHLAQEQLAAAHELLGNEAKQLEKLVEKRTADLHATVQQLETFSYSIVHDMCAPLRSMRSFASFLEAEYHEKLDARAQDYLRRIVASAMRLDGLIIDVLTYSRLGSGEMRPVSLEQLQAQGLLILPSVRWTKHNPSARRFDSLEDTLH